MRNPRSQVPANAGREWCPGRDLNSHGFPHTPLKRTCLPIPPPGQRHHGFAAQRLLPPFEGAVAGDLAGAGVIGAGPGAGGLTAPPPGTAPGATGGAAAPARRAASDTMLRERAGPRVVRSASESEVTKNSTPRTTVARV